MCRHEGFDEFHGVTFLWPAFLAVWLLDCSEFTVLLLFWTLICDPTSSLAPAQPGHSELHPSLHFHFRHQHLDFRGALVNSYRRWDSVL